MQIQRACINHFFSLCSRICMQGSPPTIVRPKPPFDSDVRPRRRRFASGVLRPPFVAVTSMPKGKGGKPEESPKGKDKQPGILERIMMGLKRAASLVACRERYISRSTEEQERITLDEGDERFYILDGKVWRKKSHKEVPAGNHSVTDVQDYVRALPTTGVAEYQDPARMPQYNSVFDFVATMRTACERKGAAFAWPSPATNLAQSFSVAMTMCPPGHMVSLNNDARIPSWLRRARLSPKGGKGTEGGDLPASSGGCCGNRGW